MKILEPGTPPKIEDAWPVGKKLYCYRCGCVFVIEAGDFYGMFTQKSGMTIKSILDCTCPTCGVHLEFSQAEVMAANRGSEQR